MHIQNFIRFLEMNRNFVDLKSFYDVNKSIDKWKSTFKAALWRQVYFYQESLHSTTNTPTSQPKFHEDDKGHGEEFLLAMFVVFVH